MTLKFDYNAYGSPERAAKIRRIPCLVCRRLPSENCHTRSRASGGTWQDIVPLCSLHHRESHLVGIKTFSQTHNINLWDYAAKFAQEILP